MTADSYDEALRRVLAHEGGYTNHPSDPGGPTNFGITIHDFRKYVKSNATAEDVRRMDLATAKDIYRAKYWNVLRCDDLPAGLDYAMFDYGVNSGTARAPKVLHRLLGMGEGTRMTDATMAAVKRHDPAALVTRLCDERLAFLKSLKTWPVFGKGWGRRVAEVRAASLAMARGEKRAVDSSAAAGKGAVPLNTTSRKAGTAAVIVAGGSSAIAAQQAGSHMSTYIFVTLATLVLAALGWFGWRWLQQRQQTATVNDGVDQTGQRSFAARLRDVLQGWKTLIFGAALTASGTALDLLDQLKAIDIAPLLPPASAVKIIAAIGVATILLRLATTGRVGQKDL
jgi:lysozyme family protein